jgi:hypothetical protein
MNDPCGIASVSKQYGKDYLIMRGIRLRATFSDKDSCNKGQLASCEWYAHVLQEYNDLELQAVVEVAIGDRLFVDSAVLDTAVGGYKEVQIHGELVLSRHVETVVVHPSRRGTNLEGKIRSWCKQIGARFEFMPSPADAGRGDASRGANCAEVPTEEKVLPVPAEMPLWRWRPCGECSYSHSGLRFDAFSTAVLEYRRRHIAEVDLLPAFPVGNIQSVDFGKMVAIASVDGIEVQMHLERRTAGMGAHARADISAGDVKGIWEWCASASGHGAWTKYDKQLSSKLEEAFRAGRSQVDLSIGDSAYSVDLELMVQANCRTCYHRLVRRRIKIA